MHRPGTNRDQQALVIERLHGRTDFGILANRLAGSVVERLELPLRENKYSTSSRHRRRTAGRRHEIRIRPGTATAPGRVATAAAR